MASIRTGEFRHIALGDVSSTNTACLDHARNGDGGGLWITAERQLQGKGSRGRQWISEPGNLYASLLLKDVGSPQTLHTLTFVASLAIRDAILSLQRAVFADVKLKWPNDVLLNGRKTSGILLESHVVDGSHFLIMGIGINIAHYPATALYPATCLANEGLDSSPGEFIQLLSHSMEKRLMQWERGEGFDRIRRDWLDCAVNLEKRIEVQMPVKGETQTVSGTFRGIDEQGLLLLEVKAGKTERISVADIFFA